MIRVKKPSVLRRFIDENTWVRFIVVRLLRLVGKHRRCIFCEIVRGELARKLIYQDDLVSAFWDAHPAASTHILIVSNRHIESLNDLQPGDAALCGHMFTIAKQLASAQNIQASGYQLIINSGLHAGQTVFHLHMHLKGLDKIRSSSD